MQILYLCNKSKLKKINLIFRILERSLKRAFCPLISRITLIFFREIRVIRGQIIFFI